MNTITLTTGKFGMSITLDDLGITYAERNNSENDMFRQHFAAFNNNEDMSTLRFTGKCTKQLSTTISLTPTKRLTA